MKLNLENLPIAAVVLRRARLAALRFALRQAGTLLTASAPLVIQAGEKLQRLSEDPTLAAPPPSFAI